MNKPKHSKKFLSSNIEWEKWGEKDPLYGVSTWHGKAKNENNSWTDDEFYNTGYIDWSDFVKHWENYGLSRISCLEIGCGAGRITKQLSQFFQNVYAIDVSQEMIDYAKNTLNQKNIKYQKTSGNIIDMKNNSVDSVFSTDVFQHFDNLEYAEKYFQEIYDVMKTEATMMIHLKIFLVAQIFLPDQRLKLQDYP